jgi:hypothetical protein
MKFWSSIFLVLFLLSGVAGCKIYSFSGANIPPEVKTFSVDLLENRAANAPASYNQIFTDQLKLKLATEANLKQVQSDGDIQFSGAITSYSVAALAPTAQVQTGVNRLNITIQVDFLNTKKENDKWSKTFSRFAEFPASEILATRENQMINEINKQLIDDVFNAALVNW